MDTNNKRVKREIANSNERRRMQSINAGFQKLKRLLPVSDGEKISKANILQQASDYIQLVEKERMILYEQNTLLRGVLIDIKNGARTVESIDITSYPAIAISQPVLPRNTDDSIHTIDNSNEDTEDESMTNARTTPMVIVPDIATLTTTITTATTTTANSTAAVTAVAANTLETTTATTTVTNVAPSTRRKSNESRLNGRRVSDSNSINNIDNNHTKIAQSRAAKHHQKVNNNSNIGNSMVEHLSNRIAGDSTKSGLAAKAAIALPLEVPYTSETAIRVGQHPDLQQDVPTSAARKLAKTESTCASHPTPKSQTLDTICKAIMEIEGERVFKDENMRHENS